MEEKRKRKIELRPVRWISYLILLLLSIFLYLFLRSYFFLSLLLLLVIWPMISGFGLWYLAGGLRGEMGLGQSKVRLGDTALLTFRLKNQSWWLALDAEWNLRLENALWNEQTNRYLAMPVRFHGNEFLTLPLRLTSLGHFRISCEELVVQDIMGLVRMRLPIELAGELDVIPPKGGQTPDEADGYLSGVSETEESKEKGNDFAEVSDIREYAPGDKIRDIHWKLSAKKDVLMVKERVAVAGSEMALTLQPGTDKKPAERVLTEAYRLSQAFLNLRVPVCLILWNQQSYDWEEYRCGSMEEVEDAFCEIFRIPVSLRNNAEWKLYMKNCFPFLGTYLHIGVLDEGAQVVMHENV